MQVHIADPTNTLISIKELQEIETAENRVFEFEGHHYAVVRISEDRTPNHVRVTLDHGVLCFNLRGHSVRVLPWDTLIQPMKGEITLVRNNQARRDSEGSRSMYTPRNRAYRRR